MSRLLMTVAVALLAFSTGCSSTHSSTVYSSSRGPAPLAAATPAQPAAMNVPGVQRTATAADALNAMAEELSRTRQTLGDTLASLDELTKAQGDLLAPYDRFMALNERIGEADKHVAERTEDMRARARDYITNWEVEVYGVEDADLRKQAESRRARVRSDYEKISDSMRSLRDAMQPFKRQLDDIKTVLANDLTPAGVRAVTPAAGRAKQSGEEVQHRLDALIGEVDRVAKEMTPSVPETTQPTTVRP